MHTEWLTDQEKWIIYKHFYHGRSIWLQFLLKLYFVHKIFEIYTLSLMITNDSFSYAIAVKQWPDSAPEYIR